jgi:anti-sigma regulatory factor (Ser/Thr protein kinase)
VHAGLRTGVPKEANVDRQQITALAGGQAPSTPHAVQATAEVRLMHPFKPGHDAEAAVLVRDFDADALAGLRKAVLGYAIACGMPEDRAFDVMLAVHELAANAVRHGPGHGRLRLHGTASALHCEVSDSGRSSRDGRAGSTGGQAPGAVPWPVEQGHGLFLVRKAADDLRVACGPDGSLVTVVFTLPAAVAPPPQACKPGVPGEGTGR